MIWTRSWCYFHCATHHHHHQQTFVWLLITSNPYCITSNHLRMVLDDIEDPIPVRMTPYPLRLQLQTLWIGVILMGKMTYWGEKYLTKVDHVMKIGILNIPAPVRMTPCAPRFQIAFRMPVRIVRMPTRWTVRKRIWGSSIWSGKRLLTNHMLK